MNSRFILALLLAAATHAAEPAPAGTVRLALSDEDLPQALALYGKLAGVTVISSPGLPMTRITHETATPMTPVVAAAALESLLAVNGVALVPAGPGTVRAVPAARAANEAPEFITGEVASLPASQRVVTRMFRPSKVSVAQAETVLRDLSTPGSSKVQTLASAGTLLVTDSLTNIQRMDRILNLIEKESAVKTIELKPGPCATASAPKFRWNRSATVAAYSSPPPPLAWRKPSRSSPNWTKLQVRRSRRRCTYSSRPIPRMSPRW